MVSRANDTFGQAEPACFAASAFANNGAPAYLYRFSYGFAPGADLLDELRQDAGPDPRKARLDVTELNTDAGKRADP